ncbi:Leishmanolysin [Mameliella alba]|uniref:leishmanolysin-related zinc metalloendopeptidase n=1 Tax=Mameliella alba TaxID=561184 RepID=UPI0008834944|nr:leishmanolysin-related zinc metalloendopeptidase [Mameliella alba]OWV50119.1 hypothetical protein CDZ96_01065 [Mameliella alba]PTR42497.1 leishmanolysin [Mameliella alba]GGF71433.1 hypothetical protein GCM10011319_35010 [Mameliella alba]SDC13133.1 Leishmanolysin [Mameliella alba]
MSSNQSTSLGRFLDSDTFDFGRSVEVIGMNGLTFLDALGAAKGGNGGGGGGGGGKPDKPGDGGDGGDGGTLLGSYTSGSQDGTGFNVTIYFSGTWTEALQQAFIDAAELISDIVTGDITDVRYRGETIDDIVIEATLTDIDGPGLTLGQAGPTVIRTATYLPAMGIMEFDIADAANYDAQGLFNDIVFHEMMHVIGFGTMWELMGLVDVGQDGSQTFNGVNANLTFDLEFSASALLSIETEGGPGTAGGHWNEDGADGFAFENEIMTGYIDGTNYLSNTSVAALEDMGYETIWDASDPTGATDLIDTTIFTDGLFA